MTEIDEMAINNLEKANEAIRDILFMYRELTNYAGLFDDFGSEDGVFDPEHYINYVDTSECLSEEDLDLLHHGSAIKIICGVLQSWSQGGYPERASYYTILAQKLLDNKQLDHIDELRNMLALCLESETKFNQYRKNIYHNYVIGYFKKLCN